MASAYSKLTSFWINERDSDLDQNPNIFVFVLSLICASLVTAYLACIHLDKACFESGTDSMYYVMKITFKLYVVGIFRKE